MSTLFSSSQVSHRHRCRHQSSSLTAKSFQGLSGFEDPAAPGFAVAILGDLHLEPPTMPDFHEARKQLLRSLAGLGQPAQRLVQVRCPAAAKSSEISATELGSVLSGLWSAAATLLPPLDKCHGPLHVPPTHFFYLLPPMPLQCSWAISGATSTSPVAKSALNAGATSWQGLAYPQR